MRISTFDILEQYATKHCHDDSTEQKQKHLAQVYVGGVVSSQGNESRNEAVNLFVWCIDVSQTPKWWCLPIGTCKHHHFFSIPGQFGCDSGFLGCWSIALFVCSGYFAVVYHEDHGTMLGKAGGNAERWMIQGISWKNKGMPANRKENDWRFQPIQIPRFLATTSGGMGLRDPQHGAQHSWCFGCIGRWTFAGCGPDTCPTWCGGPFWVGVVLGKDEDQLEENHYILNSSISVYGYTVISYTHWICFCGPVVVIFQGLSWHFSERRFFGNLVFFATGEEQVKYICDDQMCNVFSTEVLRFVVFFSDNPAYQWTMMPQVVWCQQPSLKPLQRLMITTYHQVQSKTRFN